MDTDSEGAMRQIEKYILPGGECYGVKEVGVGWALEYTVGIRAYAPCGIDCQAAIVVAYRWGADCRDADLCRYGNTDAAGIYQMKESVLDHSPGFSCLRMS